MHVMVFLSLRLVRFAFTVLLISTVVFLVVRVIPGDPAEVVAGIDAAPGATEAIRARLGTDRPLVRQYFEWLSAVVRFDFGDSFISGQPVSALIVKRFPVTLSLALTGLFISLVVAIPLGVVSAVRPWSVWYYVGVGVSQLGMAIPSFWMGILLLLLFSVKLKLFPFFGVGSVSHFVLPALSLGVARAAVLIRLTRASMTSELGKEYVLAARANGLPPARIVYRHVLKNALLPIITIAGIQLGYMLCVAIIIEQVFSLPGLGRLFLSAVYQRDFPLIQGGVVFIAVVFSATNFLADALYSVVNPKINLR